MDSDNRKAKVTPGNVEESRLLRGYWNSTPEKPNQAVFGERFEIGSQSAVTQFLNGRSPLSLKAAQGFAKGLQCDIAAFSPRLAALAHGIAASVTTSSEPVNVTSGPDIRAVRMYPVISGVQAGDWTDIYDNFAPGDADEWRESHKDLGENGYVLRVEGDSMTGSAGAEYSFPAGFLLYVNPELDALPGKFVIVRREGEKTATFKRYIMIDGEPYLEALNPIWPNRYLKLLKGDVFCGVVVHAGRDLP